MEKEDIEKAADDFADREYEYNDIDRNALYKGFYWGAQWRIKIVWHTYEEAKEVDLEKENIVIVMYPNNIYKIGKLSLYQHKKTNPATGLQEIVQEVVIEQPHNMVCLLSRCKGWAYIKDLVPNKE